MDCGDNNTPARLLEKSQKNLSLFVELLTKNLQLVHQHQQDCLMHTIQETHIYKAHIQATLASGVTKGANRQNKQVA